MWFQLMRSIVGQVWAIDPAYVESIVPFVTALLNGENPAWAQDDSPVLLIASSSGGPSMGVTSDGIPPGSIAIVSLKGPMMKNDQFCGPRGTASIAAELQRLAANSSVDGIVLRVDSPGGTVDGTEELARVYGSIKKPKVTFVDGYMASAAKWVGSEGDEIIINGQTSMVGSIGTMMSFADLRPVLEKAGVKFHNIKATRSVDKNADFEAAAAGDYTRYIRNVLDPINAVFTKAIEKNRAGKIDLEKEDVLTGKMYIGKQAVKVGLADRIGTLDDAINSVRSAVSNKKQKRSQMALIKEKYPKLAAVAAVDDKAETLENGSVEMTAEELQHIESHMTANDNAAGLQEQITALTTERDAAQASLTTAQESITSITAERDTWKKAAVEYGAKTDPPADPPKAKDKGVADDLPVAKDSFDLFAESLGL